MLRRCSQSSSAAARGIPRKDAKLAALHRAPDRDSTRPRRCSSSRSSPTPSTTSSAAADEPAERVPARLAGVTGDSREPDRARLALQPGQQRQAQPGLGRADELRVLIATDVLSEGQNLQDCAIVVNYDLPWAIIRLIQRAGRVDRIGQQAEKILCYSFLPADGVERIIRLRARVRQRLQENAEVVGTDEAFFEDDRRRPGAPRPLQREGRHPRRRRRHRGRSGLLRLPDLEERHRPPTRPCRRPSRTCRPSSTPRKPHQPTADEPDGVLVYLRTAEGNDALAWVDADGQERHRVAVRRSSRPPSARRTRRRCRATRTTTSWSRKAVRADRRRRRRRSAASSAGHPARASAPTSG